MVTSEKVVETFYNMGRIFFAKGQLRKAVQLLRKCLMIQILLYGSEHSKSRDTKKSPYSPAEVFYYREEKVYT
ncbi:Tetratricopeptide Repeat Protein 23 [Manis pentadactyla]|nr:Tetratricopeptide Repeat Protein 23 [Manis pentadactyla]